MTAPLGTEHLLCVGCRNRRWVVDFGFGHLCSTCDQARAERRQQPIPMPVPTPVPTAAAARPYSEPADRDDEEVPF